MVTRLLLFMVCLIFPLGSFAHSGGLDKFGGHKNNKTGEYHYHKDIKETTIVLKLTTGKTLTLTIFEAIEVNNCLKNIHP